MPIITDAQVEVAEGAYWAVLCSHDYGEKVRPVAPSRAAMRAALEAYERVRDLERILSPDAVDVGLKLTAQAAAEGYPVAREIHQKLSKEYQQ